MDTLIPSFIAAVAAMKANLPLVLMIIAVLWGVHLLNWISGYRLNYLGIYPRHPFGLIGVITAPFLHGHFNHLFFNTIPLFVMLSFVLINGIPVFFMVSLMIILLSGLGIWLLGRKALHIGSSSVIMGYLGYLLMNIYQQGTVVAIGIGIVCIYYFGSMLLSVFPSDVRTSWEGHLFGLMAGIVSSYLLPVLLSAV